MNHDQNILLCTPNSPLHSWSFEKTLPLTGLVKEAFLDEGEVFSDEVSAVACWKDAHSWSAADSVEGWGRFRGMTVVWIMFRNRPIVGSTSLGLNTSLSRRYPDLYEFQLIPSFLERIYD